VTYQLLRVEAEIYRPGNELKGPELVNHTNPRNGVAVWVSPTGELKDVAQMSKNRIHFTGNAVYMRFSAIGLERDTICNGSLDFWSTVKSYDEMFGDELEKMVAAATRNARMDLGIPTIVYIAVIDFDDLAGTGKFKGFLPLDGSLDQIIISPE
jgi:hypothetical protein